MRADLDVIGCRLRIKGDDAKHREHGETVWQPIPSDLSKELAAYVLTHQREALFPNARGRNRDARSLLALFRKDCSNAGIHPANAPDPRLDVHSLRGTFLINRVANAPDMDIKPLQVLARHKDISTTMKHYVRAKEDAKRRAIVPTQLPRGVGG
jgi:integrase